MRVVETKDKHGGTIVEIQSSIDPSGTTLSDDPKLSATLHLANPTLTCLLSSSSRSLNATLRKNTPIDPSGTTLSDDSKLFATLQLTNPTLICSLSSNTLALNATIQRSAPAPEYYYGPYKVRPTVEDQNLPTKDKLLRKNVDVEAIPYYETTNESGGYTVIIG